MEAPAAKASMQERPSQTEEHHFLAAKMRRFEPLGQLLDPLAAPMLPQPLSKQKGLTGFPINPLETLAPRAGLEPATQRLTAACSTN
jgi:hypothetical protein